MEKSLEIIMYAAVASSTSSSCLQQVIERERERLTNSLALAFPL
jgi:hypothetical protein